MSRGAVANERAIGKGSRRAYEDRLFAIAAFLINERGYLVLACWYGAYDVGQIKAKRAARRITFTEQ